MVQIIPPSSAKSKSQQFGEAFSRGSQMLSSHLMNEQQRKLQDEKLDREKAAVSRLTGQDLSGLSPDLLKLAYEYNLKGDLEGLKGEQKIRQLQSEKTEKLAPLESGLEVINKMRNLRSKGNLGMFSKYSGLLYPDVRKDRGEYETLGKSLISLASSIPIRNQKEFETLSGHLFDPNVTDAEAEGILDAMENIISNSMRAYQEPQSESEERVIDLGVIKVPSAAGVKKPTNKERPPLTQFYR